MGPYHGKTTMQRSLIQKRTAYMSDASSFIRVSFFQAIWLPTKNKKHVLIEPIMEDGSA